ncbi:DUF4386 domain-containing protein [Antribacter gilvus]|uniref:DUF4386 domain-containing protein n=1 Tax=Antribacter gilvus TaxID=2304675 RepID=UPI000F79F9CD|nr:DUF4386 domain-containing protein [Antribacter gilvus]
MSHRLAGRLAGALFLAVFVLYGVGDALAPRPAGLVLVLLNSAAVVVIGVLLYHPLRVAAPRAALVYLLTRITEAVVLAGGVLLLAGGNASAHHVAYTAAMVLLGLGSIPFCLALPAAGTAPRWFGLWGAAGYALLAVGVLLEPVLAGASVALAVPGGLFEITFGLLLLVRGWYPTAPSALVEPESAVRQ